MSYLGNIKKQYFISFFTALIPAYVIERLFWQERGMIVQMVVYCEIIYALTVTVFELPSGILSDKFGRKRLLIVSSALCALELIILLFAQSFLHFAVAIFFAGMGRALSSGSENALLYDSLLFHKKEAGFEKFLGRASAVDIAGSIIASLSGAAIAGALGFEFNYIISIVSLLIVFILTLTLKEPPIVTRPESELFGMRRYAREAIKEFKLNPLMLIYGITGAVVGSCLIYLDEFWQIALDEIGVPVIFFGAISSVGLLLGIPSSLFAYKIKEKFSYNVIFTFIITVCTLGYIYAFFAEGLLFLIPMIAVPFFAGLCEPLVAGYLHHSTHSDIRATVESISSLALRIFSAFVGLIFGYISSSYSVFSGFLLLGCISLTYLIFFRGFLFVKKLHD